MSRDAPSLDDLYGPGAEAADAEAQSEVEELFDENTKLREALTKLMAYTPRQRWVGGVENGHYVPAGEALIAVLDECDAALGLTPNA